MALGIESGSKYVRDGVEKGRFGDVDIVKTTDKIKEHGIYIIANYIFGLPDDTQTTMQDTLDLAQEIANPVEIRVNRRPRRAGGAWRIPDAVRLRHAAQEQALYAPPRPG